MTFQHETRTCQNCKEQFAIEPADFEFYKKINVPPPTFCPDCRRQRRLAVRNERTLYPRNCDLCKKSMIAMYPKDSVFTVYCIDCWWSDKWDASSYGRDYDFSKPFFTQFHELLKAVPRLNPAVAHVVNSDYCNYVADAKDCYLCFGSIKIENCAYGSPYESKDCFDSFLVRESELCYECIDCEKLYRCMYCQDCSGSSGLILCYDCQGSDDCIGSVGLRKKKYCIFNEQKTKEEYDALRRDLVEGKISIAELRVKFEELKRQFPNKFARVLNSEDVSGNYIVSSKDAHLAFGVKKAEHCKFVAQLIEAKDTYDTNYCEFPELCYEYIGYYKNNNVQFGSFVGESHSIRYSDYCVSSAELFGCAGLRKKQFCILNQQYAASEYRELVQKITQQMQSVPYVDKKGRAYGYGEFFPIELSPFSYNETVAYEYFPLSKEAIATQGYLWREPEIKEYPTALAAVTLPKTIVEVGEEILKQAIRCGHEGKCSEKCTGAFKFIPTELAFYRQMGIPPPHLCPSCRHFARLNQRTPYKLWHRECMCERQGHAWHTGGCPNEFETTYSTDRLEIVYCEQCYNAEVV